MANETAREIVDRYLRSGQTPSQIVSEAREVAASYQLDGLTTQAERERAVMREAERRRSQQSVRIPFPAPAHPLRRGRTSSWRPSCV